MSQFSYSQSPLKRSRTMSEMSSTSNSKAVYALSAPKARTYVTPKREVGGAGVQKGGTAGKKKKGVSLKMSHIARVLFPISRVKLLNYGENWYGLTGASLTRKGSCKALRGIPGKQVWFECIGLPLYHPQLGGNAGEQPIVPSVYALDDLRIFATTNRQYTGQTNLGSLANDAQVQVNTATSAAGTTNGLKEVVVNYLGGYQKHTFINVGNSHAFLEILECHPREPMFDWYMYTTSIAGQRPYKYKGIGDWAIKDLQDNMLKAAGGTSDLTDAGNISFAPVSLTFDDVTDKLCNVNTRSRTVHALFKVSKPIKVALAPGETFHYTMRFDPFLIDEGEMLRYLEVTTTNAVNGGGSAGTATNVSVRPTSIPRFTKRLVVRAWGEAAHSSMTISVTDSATLSTNNTAQPTYVMNAPVQLLHMQEEYHTLRDHPSDKKTYSVQIDERDQPQGTNHLDPGTINDGDIWNLSIVNEEQDSIEVIN